MVSAPLEPLWAAVWGTTALVPGLLSPTTDPTRDLACFAPFAVSLIERVGGRTRSWGLLDFEVTSRTPSISADSAVVLRNKRPGVPRTCHLTAALKFGRGSYATEGWSNSESRVEPRLPILPSGRESRMSIDVRTFQARGPARLKWMHSTAVLILMLATSSIATLDLYLLASSGLR